MEYLQAIILGVVEGLTEFLPVSSTGHLIIAGQILGFTGERANTFEIFIQLGAILAIVVLYWRRFLGLLDFKEREGFHGLNGLALLLVVSLPAGIMGLLLRDFIKSNLFNVTTVAIGLAIGGLALILVERVIPKPEKVGLDSLTWREALVVGLFQCLALWPGVSRSASTIVGGLLYGVDRRTAAEFSFFAAVPVLFAATFYDLIKSLKVLHTSDIPLFAVGFIVAFLTALVAVRFFLSWLNRATLSIFGYYRLVVAVLVLIFLSSATISG